MSHVDLMPTLCEYLDLKPGHQMDGQSLLPLLSESEEDKEGTVFIQFDGNGARSNFSRCVVQGKYKLIADLFKDEVYYELYDIDNDRQEKNNLMFCPDYDKIAENMMVSLCSHMVETGDLLSLPVLSPEAFRLRYGRFPVKY